jgi:hypothetical protein
MPDALTVAAVLLVAGPVLGTIGLGGDPGLYRVWTAPREEHLAIVAARRRSWALANAGFTVATVLTAAGLVILAGALPLADGYRAILTAVAVGYAIAGTLWCAVVAIRDRTTPVLAGLVAAGAPTEPAEAMLGGLIGGLFASFAVTTSVALAGLGLVLALGGGVVAPVAWLAVVIGVGSCVWVARSGDMIPAVLYLPTLILGIALLAGWS